MIRIFIKASILILLLGTIGPISQVAVALDLDFSDGLNSANDYSYSWTHESISIQGINRTQSLFHKPVQKSLYENEIVERKFSFGIYRGDGLDQFRQNTSDHSYGILPEEDTDTYGISIKQRF